ncbi:MAG: metal-sensitive transcriptional regulator [Pseudoclavibacter sp.]
MSTTGSIQSANGDDTGIHDAHDSEYGYIRHRDQVLARLKRVEGQVRGIQRMVDEGEYCIDILTQISAASSALRSVALSLLDDHLDHCVAHAVHSGDSAEVEAKLAEASGAIARLVRS